MLFLIKIERFIKVRLFKIQITYFWKIKANFYGRGKTFIDCCWPLKKKLKTPLKDQDQAHFLNINVIF